MRHIHKNNNMTDVRAREILRYFVTAACVSPHRYFPLFTIFTISLCSFFLFLTLAKNTAHDIILFFSLSLSLFCKGHIYCCCSCLYNIACCLSIINIKWIVIKRKADPENIIFSQQQQH